MSEFTSWLQVKKEFNENKEDKVTVTITAPKSFMTRFLKFLSMIQRAGKVGHSAFFAIFVDGDGSDFVEISGVVLPDVKSNIKNGNFEVAE